MSIYDKTIHENLEEWYNQRLYNPFNKPFAKLTDKEKTILLNTLSFSSFMLNRAFNNLVLKIKSYLKLR